MVDNFHKISGIPKKSLTFESFLKQKTAERSLSKRNFSSGRKENQNNSEVIEI